MHRGCIWAAFGCIGAAFGCIGAAFGCIGAAFGCIDIAIGCTGAVFCCYTAYMQYLLYIAAGLLAGGRPRILRPRSREGKTLIPGGYNNRDSNPHWLQDAR